MILVKGASQIEVENYANIETQKVAKWARNNKMSFNDQKSKVIIITKKKPKNRRDTNIFLNNKYVCMYVCMDICNVLSMYVCTFFLIYLLACSIALVISNTTCYLHLVFTLIVSLLLFVFIFLACPSVPSLLVYCCTLNLL
jgi:hypothetical protein